MLYSVLLNGVKRRDMRYSQLRALHDQLLDETTTYAQMKLLPFPDKTPFGRALSDRGVERRRIALEINLDTYLVNIHITTTLKAPASMSAFLTGNLSDGFDPVGDIGEASTS